MDRAAIRAPRRIRVSPSSPPVSATTTRSRASQVPWMPCCGPVPLQALVHLVGQPEQGQFPQRGEVAGAEVVGQRGVDLLRRVDVPVRHPAAQRLRGDVDQFDLVGGADHGVRHGLPLRHSGDLLDDVVQGLQVLDVDVGDDLDARGQQFLDVLPALGVPRARHVGVRELVDQRDLRLAGQHGVEVHLLEHRAPVGDLGAGDDLQAVQQRRGVRAAVRLHERHDHVGAALDPPVPLAEHVEGLARRRPRRRGRSGAARAPARHGAVSLPLPKPWSQCAHPGGGP